MKENGNNKYSLAAIFGLTVLYYLAVIIISFAAVFLEFSNVKEIGQDYVWFFILPLPFKIVRVNFLLFIIGVLTGAAGCVFLGRWHFSVISKNARAYTNGWLIGYILLLIFSVILCLIAEVTAYALTAFDSQVELAVVILPVSFLTIPIIMLGVGRKVLRDIDFREG